MSLGVFFFDKSAVDGITMDDLGPYSMGHPLLLLSATTYPFGTLSDEGPSTLSTSYRLRLQLQLLPPAAISVERP